jgi:CRISPR/Cas system-associated exonuclease Cas4 (RecB family)
VTNPLTHLSVSSLKEYLACPRKFRLRRIDRLLPEYRPAALAFGTAFHEAIGFSLFQHSLGETATGEALQAKFRDSLHAQIHSDTTPVLYQDDETEEGLVDKGIQMLDAFWQQMPMPDAVIGIEKRFSLDLHDPDTGEVLPPLVGSIDAAVEVQGRPVVWELKTGKQRWSEDQLLHDFQATGYQRAFRTEYGMNPELVVAVVTKTRQPTVQLSRLRRGPGDERELLETASSICRAVEAGVDHRVRTWACKSCEYAGACR